MDGRVKHVAKVIRSHKVVKQVAVGLYPEVSYTDSYAAAEEICRYLDRKSREGK